MKVLCKYNDPMRAKSTHRYTGPGSGNNTKNYMLTVGKQYSVYAKIVIGTRTMYLILDDANHSPPELLKHYGLPNPSFYNADLFGQPDVPHEPGWQKVRGTVFTRYRGYMTSFPEFVSNGAKFYENLLDGNPDAVTTFLKYIAKYEYSGKSQ